MKCGDIVSPVGIQKSKKLEAMNIPQTSASQSRPPARPKLVWSPVKTGSNQPSEHSCSSSYGPLPSARETVSAVTKGADFQLHVRNGELVTFPRLPVHSLQNKQTILHEEKVFGQKVRWFMVEVILEREVTPSLKEEEKGEEVLVGMGYESRQEGQIMHPLLEFDKLGGQVSMAGKRMWERPEYKDDKKVNLGRDQ